MSALVLGLFFVWSVQTSPEPPPKNLSLSVLLEARSTDIDLSLIDVVAVAKGQERAVAPQERNGDTVYFELAADSKWSITCRGETFWCPSISITTQPNESTSTRHRLPVARRVKLRSKLEVSQGEPPKAVRLQGWELKAAVAEPLRLELDATVVDRQVDLELPDVPLDLRVAAAGFAPLYTWGLKPSTRPKAADGAHSLGTWTLRPGSSLCGFVTDSVTGDPSAQAEIRLRVPPHRPGTPQQTARGLERMAWQTQSNARGFFQIVGPPAGVYRLEVTPTSAERLPRIVRAVELADQSETCLDTLEVYEAIPFRVLLEDAPSAAESSSWRVRLSPASVMAADGYVSPEGPQVPGFDGFVRFLVAPGDYRLTVFSTDPEMKILSREITIQAEQTLPVRLDVLPVEGHVLLGETPVVAEIDLKVDDGGSARLESDGEGRFRGWTRRPEDGLAVQVKAVYPAFSRYVLFDRNDVDIENGVLRLELEFPDRRITGIVRDETGRPVRLAEVMARPESSRMSISTTTGVDGRFELVGLEDTPLKVWASARDFGKSEGVRVEPWGEEANPDVSLVLRRGRKLEGRVLTDLGEPVASGRVRLMTVGERPSSGHDTTNIGGHFEVYVPDTEARAVVQVFSPNLTWSTCLALPPEGQNLEIRMPSTLGGSVYLPYDEGAGPFSQHVLVNAEGGFFTLSHLVNYGQVRRVDGGYMASAIAPGAYASLSSDAGLTNLSSRVCDQALPVESWQSLVVGQELRLDLNR